jgi:hypothetical protein
MTAGGRYVLVDQEPRPHVGATFHDKESLSAFELALWEATLFRCFLFKLEGGEADGGLFL